MKISTYLVNQIATLLRHGGSAPSQRRARRNDMSTHTKTNMLNPYIQTILTAAIPIGELRLAIPVALTKLGLSVPEAYVFSVLGNLIPVVLLLLLFEAVSAFMMRHSPLSERFFNWLFRRTREKIDKRYRTLGYLALVLFIAIPLPITGAWTGTLAAYLLGIPFWRALGLITIGVLIAGAVVTAASLGVIAIV